MSAVYGRVRAPARVDILKEFPELEVWRIGDADAPPLEYFDAIAPDALDMPHSILKAILDERESSRVRRRPTTFLVSSSESGVKKYRYVRAYSARDIIDRLPELHIESLGPLVVDELERQRLVDEIVQDLT